MSEQSIYIIGTSRDGPLKIGIAANPWNRLRELQTGSAVPLRLFWSYACWRPADREALIHRILGRYRLTGEWFEVPVEMAMAAIWIAAESYDGSYTHGWQIDVWKASLGFPGCDLETAQAAVPADADADLE